MLILLLIVSACGAGEGGGPPSSSFVPQPPEPTIPPTTATSATTTSSPPTTQQSPAERLLATMSLSEKAAQVLLVGFFGTTASSLTPGFMAETTPGGVVLLKRNVETTDQLQKLTAALQDRAAATDAGIALLVAVDQEGGPVRRIEDDMTPMPAARTLGTKSTPEEAGALAAQTAEELLTLGVNMNLAPVADVVEDDGSFLYRRSYSGDPERVAAFVSAVVAGYEDNGLVACPKHFPGHGSADGNTHSEDAVAEATAADYEAVHLPPFIAGFDAGAEAVMVAHIVAGAYDPEHPASSSSAVIEGLLRDELGFAGLVVTDDIEMAAAAGKQADGAGSDEAAAESSSGITAVECLRAGADLVITLGPLETQQAIIAAIAAAVDSGTLSGQRLDEAVLRILELKQRKGLAPFG